MATAVQNAPPVDFAAVVQALQDRAGSLLALSARIGVSRGALRGYLDGSQPPHTLGCQLIAEWCTVTGLGDDQVPRAIGVSTKPRCPRPRSCEGPRINQGCLKMLVSITSDWN